VNLRFIAEGEEEISSPNLYGFVSSHKELFARKIGTYELSIRPYPDVCVINARKPSTKC